MKTAIGALLLLAILISVGCNGKEMNEESYIGVATMDEKGTIVLQLRATDESATGDALFEYNRGDPDYEKIVEHLGGMSPGDEKPVPPWPQSD